MLKIRVITEFETSPENKHRVAAMVEQETANMVAAVEKGGTANIVTSAVTFPRGPKPAPAKKAK